MKPFRTKDAESEKPVKTVPSEVKEYYQAEKQDRLGAAWLLSIATFVATVIVVVGLFFAGRWTYRAINQDKVDTPTAQIGKNNNKPAESKQPVNPTPAPAASAPKPQPVPAPTPTPVPTPTPAPASAPADMPRTGPEDMTE